MERSHIRHLCCVCLLTAAFLSGCRAGGGRVVPSPLGYDEQAASVLKIAPVGTPREQAVESLAAAGIEGVYSVGGNSIYYCDLWRREDGRHWHLNVALLFDAEGRVKETRPAQSDIQAETGSRSEADPQRPAANSRLEPAEPPTASSSDAIPTGASARSQHRTPFAEPSERR